ncbi:MAG: SDR family oxidoreductase [Proteobacteria bacterium]|nr:SDR family oxidoreductase [Pseudomonadota bacterium]
MPNAGEPNAGQKVLAGKVAVVTGAARNIGRAIALALAGDGAAVVVGARSDGEAARAVADEVTALGGRGLAHLADVSDEAAVNGLADAAIEAFGRIDILVNNASIRRQQPFEAMTYAQWREITGVNLDGPFLCAKACVPHMLAVGGGAIVNIGGVAGHAGAINRAHVVAAKAGLVGLTKALAVEFAAHGITVNCVVPGLIDTVRGATAESPDPHPGGQRSLIDRLGRPEEIAAMVHHLCLPGAAYVTGQTIHVNGGRYLP